MQTCRHLAFVLMILPVIQIAWLEKLKTNSNRSVYPKFLHCCFPFLSPLVCERLPCLSVCGSFPFPVRSCLLWESYLCFHIPSTLHNINIVDLLLARYKIFLYLFNYFFLQTVPLSLKKPSSLKKYVVFKKTQPNKQPNIENYSSGK